jgi:hypothetical protein
MQKAATAAGNSLTVKPKLENFFFDSPLTQANVDLSKYKCVPSITT